MIIKQAFLDIFNKFMVFCISMTGATFAAYATIPSEYVQIIPDDTTQYPETLTGYTINMLNNGYFNSALAGDDGYPGYVRRSLSSSNITVSGTGVYTAFVQGVPAKSNSVNGINIYAYQGKTTYIRLRYIGTDMWGNDVNITTTSQANNYFSSNPTPVLYKITTTTNNVHVAAKRISDGVFGYYCTSGDCIATNDNTQVKFIPVYGMTGTVNPCPGGTLQTYTTVASTDVPAGVQNGTPTPTNPIEPVFYQQGKMTLRRIGNIADSYDATTGKITRRVGVKALDGTEEWSVGNTNTGVKRFYIQDSTFFADWAKGVTTGNDPHLYCTHFPFEGYLGAGGNSAANIFNAYLPSSSTNYLRFTPSSFTTTAEWKQYLAEQYAAGTPVIVYYPLVTETTEDWAEESYCRPSIKIATRAYNTAQFAPVVSALNTAVNTIKDVVTNTINQTAAVSALQSTKQTRPDEGCPQYRQCLLVETEDGTPQWFVITDPFRDLFSPVIANNIAAVSTTYQVGVPSEYTQLEYIKFTGTQYIDTGLALASNSLPFLIDVDMSFADQSGRYLTGFSGSSPGYAGRYRDGRFEINNSYTTMKSGVNQRLNFQYGNIASQSNKLGIQVTKNGQTEIKVLDVSSFESTAQSWVIFANHAGTSPSSPVKGNIYFARAYKNGVLRFNGIPVSKVENGVTVAGLFDTVSGNFFGNNGTGSIIAGDPVPNQTTQWTATFSANDTYGYGRSIVYGTAKCNATSGSANDVATAAQIAANNWTATGSNCWCYAERVSETGSGSTGTSTNRWVYLTVPSGETCAVNCVENCANAVGSGAAADKPFRQAITGI